MDAEILNVYSNIAGPEPGLTGAHGQSFLISMGKSKVLFDTGGSGGILLANMACLKVEPGSITNLVLSTFSRSVLATTR
nr:hypothetical protein [Candidatus Sigynarchaeota archaeon]